MRLGVMAIAATGALYSIYASIVNAHPNRKLMGYGYRDQIKDLSPALGLSAVMGIIVFLLGYLRLPAIVLLAVQVFAGAVIYIILSIVFKMEIFYYILDLLKSYKKK